MYCYYYTSNSLKSKFSKQQKNVFRLNKPSVDIILLYYNFTERDPLCQQR